MVENGVCEGGFADIRASDDGDFHRTGQRPEPVAATSREFFFNLGNEFADATAVLGADGNERGKAETREFGV